MNKTTKLLSLIRAPKLLVMPAAYDAVSAKLIEEAGYDAVQCSGLGIALSRWGLPDVSVVSMGEMAECTRVIARSVALPVMADGDTGYGNVVNTWYTVREFEAAGAAGINLEDQILPKRCGRLAGKELVSCAEMVEKIHAAVDAKGDPDFVINARSDALSLFGIEEVINRGNAYIEAGASMFFVEGLRSREEIQAVVRNVQGPIAMNLMEDETGSGLQGITIAELESLGIARVSLSVTTLLAAMRGIQRALETVKQLDTTRFDPALHASFQHAHQLAGMNHVETLTKAFG